MESTSNRQSFQDWITQKWIIIFGKKIDSNNFNWLLGPFGNTNGIGEKFIRELSDIENLEINKSEQSKGLLKSIKQLELTQAEIEKLSKDVIDFYENTSAYDFELKTKWNPFFKFFGHLLKLLFSNRIEQLNIPLNNEKSKGIISEVIQLVDKETREIKRTIWLRKFKETNQIVYSGVYETCKIPNGTNCIKAIFPLPNGSATVILQPSIGDKGELILKSEGKRIGDSGFYFLLKDKKGCLWTKYIKSFKDNLTVESVDGKITANQVLTFYGLKVLNFEYKIRKNTYNKI